jgi:hypothetical protein
MARTRVSSGQIVGNLVFDGDTGITVPRGNTANRNPSPNQGEIRYNTDLNVMEIYNGSAWGSMGPFPFAFVEYFVGDGTTYEFVLSKNVTDQDDIIVTNNGVVQRAGLDFRIIDNNILSFTEEDSTQNPPIDGAEINVRGYSPITSASIPAGSVTLNELAFSDGSAGQFLTTDGNGNLSFSNVTFPSNYAVGGDVSGTTDNIQIRANTIGITELKVSDGQIGQVLATDGNGNLSFITVTGGSGGGGVAVTNFFDLQGQIAYSQVPNSFITIEKLNVVDGNSGDVLSTDGNGNLSFVSPNNISTTDNLTEGSNNLYFTNVRADARADLRIGAADISDLNNVDATSPSTGEALVYNGVSGQWEAGAVASSQNLFATFTADSGSTTANTTTDTFNIVGGTNITTSIVGDTITINSSAGGGTQNIFQNIAVAGQNTVAADTTSDTLTLAEGSGLTITTNNLTDTITFAVDNANKFTSVVSDNGTVTPASTNDAITIAGGTGIGTIVAGSTLTINNDAPKWLTISSDSGSTNANTVSDTLTIAGGTGISTAIVGDTLTINSSSSISNFQTIAVAGQSDVVADQTGDTLTIVAGSNITITTDPTTDEITINASAGSGGTGTVTSGLAGRLAYYSSTGTTVVNTSSGMSWNNGTNTLTLQNLNLTGSVGNITSTGTVTANTIDAQTIQSSSAGVPTFESGSDIIFDAAGEINVKETKITRLADPTNPQDAATKKYVDENTLTSFDIGADDSTMRTIGPGESFKIIGGTNVTTSSDAEGNITINSSAGGGTNAFANINVSGQTTVAADTATDTLTLVAGTNVTITTNASTDEVTINASSGATNLNGLSDVSTAGVAAGDTLYYNGSSWEVNSGPVIEWLIGANGASDYTFQGPGITGTQNDPDLYLYKGFTYIFNNTTGNSHPFYIKTTPGTGTGNLYSTGVTNNGSLSGNKTIFEVPMNAPATLYYQCSLHTSMVGTINIV